MLLNNVLQESNEHVRFNLPVIRAGKRYIGKIMAISQVSETHTDIRGALKWAGYSVRIVHQLKCKIFISYLVIFLIYDLNL